MHTHMQLFGQQLVKRTGEKHCVRKWLYIHDLKHSVFSFSQLLLILLIFTYLEKSAENFFALTVNSMLRKTSFQNQIQRKL